MGTDHERARVGVLGEEATTGGLRLRGVGVGDRGPRRLGELHRMVREITRDQCLLTVRLDAHGNVTGRVAGRELEPDVVGDLVIGRHEIGEPGVDDGRAPRRRG